MSTQFLGIERDLGRFKAEGITQAQVAAAAGLPGVVRFAVVDGTLYRSPQCAFEARCDGVAHFLHAIAKSVPNVEIAINVRDLPVTHSATDPPVFSFSKGPPHHDILYPAWTFWAGGPAVWPLYPTGLGRWDLQRDALAQSSTRWPWSAKTPKAFFRGSRTSGTRDPAVLLSRKHPELIDAGYVKNQGYRSPADLLDGPEAELVKLEDHCQWKVLLNYRGVAASFRHKHLFLCESLVFHVDDGWEEFYYPMLQPWVHYVPLRPDSRDLEHLLRFFLRHDGIAREIATAGAVVIREHLRMADVEAYWVELLRQYARLMRWEVTRASLPREMLVCSADGRCVPEL